MQTEKDEYYIDYVDEPFQHPPMESDQLADYGFDIKREFGQSVRDIAVW